MALEHAKISSYIYVKFLVCRRACPGLSDSDLTNGTTPCLIWNVHCDQCRDFVVEVNCLFRFSSPEIQTIPFTTKESRQNALPGNLERKGK